jgi:spore coat protein H
MSSARLTSTLTVQEKTKFHFGGARRIVPGESHTRNQRHETVPPSTHWRWLGAQRNKRQQEANGTFLGRWLVPVMLVAAIFSAHAADSKKSDASDAYFRDAAVRTLQIEVPASSLSALKEGQRDYVRATVREGSLVWHDVGVRLKGHGSFQPITRKPNFALKFNEFVSGQDFHGLTKVMLNNCAQDPSYLREVITTGLFHDAGIPTARVTHERVQLNGRELGFYVLVEGVNKNMLKREFGNAAGNLYEGETKDIDQRLDQENGDETTQKDLQALAAAARRPVAERMQAIRAVLDVDEFITYLAMEMLTASIDGYAFTKNNYRIYHQPRTDRLVFLPHGLEMTLGSAGFEPPQSSLLAKSLLELPECQQQYRARLSELGNTVWQVPVLTNRIAGIATRLIAAAPDRALARMIEEEARKLNSQVAKQQQLLAAETKRAKK